MAKFAQDHEEVLSQEQKILLKKKTDNYREGGKDVQSVLMIIADILNKGKKKVIILVDELFIPWTCKAPTTKEGRKSYEVDFTYLSQYKNVHFILCLNPMDFQPPLYGKEYELNLPEEQQDQLYKILVQRHRNAKMILEFLRFWQEKVQFHYQSITNEQILESESLPPLLEGAGHGVIWIRLKNDFKKKFAVERVNEIFCQLKGIPSVVILHNGEVASSDLAKEIKERNENILGLHHEVQFNGKEAEVIVYISSDEYGLLLQSMSRARQLLIIITHGKNWNDDSKIYVKAMNEAVKKNLVKKMKYQMIQRLKKFFL